MQLVVGAQIFRKTSKSRCPQLLLLVHIGDDEIETLLCFLCFSGVGFHVQF